MLQSLGTSVVTDLKNRDLEGRLKLVQGGSSQAAAAAPDEAQGGRIAAWPVFACTCQQHLHTSNFVSVIKC